MWDSCDLRGMNRQWRERGGKRVDRPSSKAGGLKEYYFSAVSTLAVLYALLLAALGLGQAVGADNTLRHLNKYLQVPEWGGSHAYPALFALLMVYLAYHLWFKKRAALVVLVSIIFVHAVFDLAGGMNPGWWLANMGIAAFFLTAWWAFRETPDSFYIRRCAVLAVLTTPVIAVYGTTGLYLGRKEYGVPGDAVSLTKNTWLVIVGRGTAHFAGRDLLFKYTLIAAAIAVMAYMLFLLFRPHRPPPEFTWDEEETARRILKTHGGDSLSYFNTRKGKSFFFLEEECFLAYRVVGGMALVSADPIGREDLFPRLLNEFSDYCLRMGWRLSGVGQSDHAAVLLRAMGLHVFVLGEESLVDVTGFSLEGRSVRKLRQSVSLIERTGVSIEFMYNASIPTHLRHELQEISKSWRGDNPETGYAMGLGRLLSISDPDCLLSLAYDEEQNPVGFLYFVPMYPHEGYSLDITRTRIGAPRPLSDYLLARTALFLKNEGYRYMSLHFLALSQYYRKDSEHKQSRLWRFTAKQIDRWFPVISAYDFDTKFSPEWVRRYLIYPSYLEFLRAGFTVIAAESALKLTRAPERKRRELAAAQAAE
jgi:lysyl-tRNA synthetase class 2